MDQGRTFGCKAHRYSKELTSFFIKISQRYSELPEISAGKCRHFFVGHIHNPFGLCFLFTMSMLSWPVLPVLNPGSDAPPIKRKRGTETGSPLFVSKNKLLIFRSMQRNSMKYLCLHPNHRCVDMFPFCFHL